MEVGRALFKSEPRLCQISINMLLNLLRLYIECLCVEMGDALYQSNVLLRLLISICSKGDSRACKSEIGLHHFFDASLFVVIPCLATPYGFENMYFGTLAGKNQLVVAT